MNDKKRQKCLAVVKAQVQRLRRSLQGWDFVRIYVHAGLGFGCHYIETIGRTNI
jgi:hypothetical protein